MANTWFKFKQFTIQQDKSAMKVGTDGVLLGAWTDTEGTKNILDIGTGTGLLALMLAQRSSAIIDGVEIDISASAQALDNIKKSPWFDRIRIFNLSFQEFINTSKGDYDLIVSNPPYFIRSLKTPSSSRNLARHDDKLSKNDLLGGVSKLLAPEGTFAVILPFDISGGLIDLASEYGLYPKRIMKVRPAAGKMFNRTLLEVTRYHGKVSETELTIETGGRKHYSDEYLRLTHEYYLDQ